MLHQCFPGTMFSILHNFQYSTIFNTPAFGRDFYLKNLRYSTTFATPQFSLWKLSWGLLLKKPSLWSNIRYSTTFLQHLFLLPIVLIHHHHSSSSFLTLIPTPFFYTFIFTPIITTTLRYKK